MSQPYATPLQLDIRPSAYFKNYSLLFYLLIIIAIINYPLPWLSRGLLIAGITIYLLLQFKKHVQHYRIVWGEENHWTLETNGEQVIAWLMPDSFVSSWLVVLNFKDVTGRSYSILLFNDSLDREQLRRLRVRLKVDNPVFKNMLE